MSFYFKLGGEGPGGRGVWGGEGCCGLILLRRQEAIRNSEL